LSARRTSQARKPSALNALTLAEKGELLDHLLAVRPELREQAEVLARGRLVDGDRSAVADDVESALRYHDIDELNSRAGHHPGRGYVDPGEATDEILDESLQPFLDDLVRRGELGRRAAAVELAVGIVCGLYACRDAGSETLLEYSPDYPVERAGEVARRCAKLEIELPVDDLLDLVPDWSSLLYPLAPRGCPDGDGAAGRPAGRKG
jgi:hypothetical protein